MSSAGETRYSGTHAGETPTRILAGTTIGAAGGPGVADLMRKSGIVESGFPVYNGAGMTR